MHILNSPGSANAAAIEQYVRIANVRAVPGYLPGWQQPVVTVDFEVSNPPPMVVLEFVRHATDVVGRLPRLGDDAVLRQRPAIQCVAQTVLAMLRLAEWPLATDVRRLEAASLPAHQIRLAFPVLSFCERELVQAIESVLHLLHALGTPGWHTAHAHAGLRLRESLNVLHAGAPVGMNTARFLEAAGKLGIPWRRVVGNVYQFGWGARSRLLDSSLTDATPAISARFCHNKQVTAHMLRQAGLPAPEHQLVANEAEARRAADTLGYPVVVKPADRDRGEGVHAYITDEPALAAAFADASAFSEQVLVEKHHAGKDYRITVYEGRVQTVAYRKPAGVTGDGVRTVKALIDDTNADPRRGPPGSRRLKWIRLDDEAYTWLERQGLALDSVPDKDLFVRLRSAANVTTGGTRHDAMPGAHADNLALAERAAEILRLDLAGIDLILPDIRRSWLETGGVICEVNAQPQMAPEMPERLLRKIAPGQGRIPVNIIVGALGRAQQRSLQEALYPRPGAGHATLNDVRIGAQTINRGRIGSFQAAQCLSHDRTVTSITLQIGDVEFLMTGCPFDRIDNLILAHPHHAEGDPDQSAYGRLAAMLAAMSRNTWSLNDAQLQCLPGLEPRPVDFNNVLHTMLTSIE